MHMHATALFSDRHAAHTAVDQLAQAGFARNEVSVAMTEQTHEREFGSSSPNRSGIRPAPYAGVMGAIVAGLALVTTSGSLPLRVGGPLLTTLLHAGALSVALLAVGMVEREAVAVSNALARGEIVVGVHASSDRVGLAMQLLELAGGSALEAA